MKIQKKWGGALLSCCMLLTACGGGGSAGSSSAAGSQAYHKITAEEAKNMMDQDSPVIVVDVRRADEYEAGHISGAILIPNEEINGEQPEALPELDAVILVYCRSGARSKQAADKLVEIGYQNVYDFGGIIDWPYGTVTGGPDE